MLAASECQQQVNAGCAWRWCRTCTADVVCVAATVTSICAVWGASLWMRSHDCPPALYQDTAAVEGRLRLALVHVMCAVLPLHLHCVRRLGVVTVKWLPTSLLAAREYRWHWRWCTAGSA